MASFLKFLTCLDESGFALHPIMPESEGIPSSFICFLLFLPTRRIHKNYDRPEWGLKILTKTQSAISILEVVDLLKLETVIQMKLLVRIQ